MDLRKRRTLGGEDVLHKAALSNRSMCPPPGKGAKHSQKGEGDAEPGEGIAEVVVGNGEAGLAGARPPRRVGDRIEVDPERRYAVEAAGARHLGDVAHKPAVVSGLVLRHETAARLGGAHEAGDRYLAGWRRFAPSCGIA